MTRLFISLYAGILITVFLFLGVAHWINTYLIIDVENELRAERMTAEIELLESLAPQLSDSALAEHLKRIGHHNQVIIERVDPSAIPADVQARLSRQTVWADDRTYDYFKAFTPPRFYRFREDPSSELLDISGTVDGTIMAALLVMMAMTCLAWFYLFYRKLKRLETAFNAVGDGDLNARAPTGKRMRVGQLNDRFNAMVERLSQLVTSHRRLTRTVAHELRTPLFRMQLQLDLLAKARPDAIHSHIQGLENNIEALQDRVDELLQFAKAERSELTLTPSTIELTPFLENLVDANQDDTDRSIALDRPVGLPTGLYADEALLYRALDNLIRNAVKYGGANIRVGVSLHSNSWVFGVEDDGPGIDPADADTLFTPFQRGTNHQGRPGYGLGLSIAREIAQLHGGRLEWCADVSSVTRFELVLPVTDRFSPGRDQ